MNKLFVGNLSWNTDDNSLRAAFGRFGSVRSAKVITDRDSGRSRGFGFVEFENSNEAEEALSQMDGADLDGRNIRVNEAQERRGGGGRRGGDHRQGGDRRDNDNRRGGGYGGGRGDSRGGRGDYGGGGNW